MPLTVTTFSTPGTFFGDRRDLLHDRVGALLRSAVGQLCADDQIALVLVRQERGRHARQPPDRNDDENKRKDHHGARCGASSRRSSSNVAPLGGAKDGVEAAIEKVAPLKRDRRPQP